MHAGVDAVPPVDGMQMNPETDRTPLMAIYFVVFMIFGSQFILNLFVGVIMDNFNKIKDKEELGSLFVTDEQRSWIDAHKLGQIQKLQKMVEPPKGWRNKFFYLVNHKLFEGFITFFIGFNTLSHFYIELKLCLVISSHTLSMFAHFHISISKSCPIHINLFYSSSFILFFLTSNFFKFLWIFILIPPSWSYHIIIPII